MNASRIRGFLLQLPRPHAVRVTGDGEPQILKPGRSYAKLADSIVALSPLLVECLDANGDILRAQRLDDAESRRSDAAEVPEALKVDPHALMLTHFANLLHRAYEHSTDIAFTRLVELADKMNDRADSIESRLERTEAANRQMLRDQVDDAFDRADEIAAEAVAKAAEGGGTFEQQLLSAFMAGRANAATKAAANGTSKGKA